MHVTTVHKVLDTRIFYREALTAHKAGLKVAVVGPHDGPETIRGIQILPISKPEARLMRRLISPLQAAYEVIKARPTIVHFHDPEFIAAAFILKLIGYRVVWDVHEYYSEVQTAHLAEGSRRNILRSLIRLLVEKWPCALFDRSVFPTETLRRVVCSTEKSVACVNLLPVDEFPDCELETTKVYDLVFMGSMSPFRAGPFMSMIACLRKSRPNFRALLLGVPQDTWLWMRANAPSQDTLNAMTYQPRVPHSEVAALIRSARLGFNYHPMQPRFEVALPMKVYEYMACGIPVVCSRFPELAEQLQDNEIVLVDGDDPADYAAAIDALLSDSERMNQIAIAGASAIRRRLNWECREAPKLISMYRELLN